MPLRGELTEEPRALFPPWHWLPQVPALESLFPHVLPPCVSLAVCSVLAASVFPVSVSFPLLGTQDKLLIFQFVQVFTSLDRVVTSQMWHQKLKVSVLCGVFLVLLKTLYRFLTLRKSSLLILSPVNLVFVFIFGIALPNKRMEDVNPCFFLVS